MEEMNKEDIQEEATQEQTESKTMTPEEAVEEAIQEAKKESKTTEDSEKKQTKKSKTLKKKKDKKDEMIEDLNDRLIRSMAEFDNFRKRSEKEKSAMFEMGAKSVLEKILPVVDNFERGIESTSEEEMESPFAKGIEAVYKQLLTSLDEMGVKPIEAMGQEFNPDFHNAVMHDENEEFGENTISQEFQKGYLYKDSVIRHSMVKVSN